MDERSYHCSSSLGLAGSPEDHEQKADPPHAPAGALIWRFSCKPSGWALPVCARAATPALRQSVFPALSRRRQRVLGAAGPPGPHAWGSTTHHPAPPGGAERAAARPPDCGTAWPRERRRRGGAGRRVRARGAVRSDVVGAGLAARHLGPCVEAAEAAAASRRREQSGLAESGEPRGGRSAGPPLCALGKRRRLRLPVALCRPAARTGIGRSGRAACAAWPRAGAASGRPGGGGPVASREGGAPGGRRPAARRGPAEGSGAALGLRRAGRPGLSLTAPLGRAATHPRLGPAAPRAGHSAGPPTGWWERAAAVKAAEGRSCGCAFFARALSCRVSPPFFFSGSRSRGRLLGRRAIPFVRLCSLCGCDSFPRNAGGKGAFSYGMLEAHAGRGALVF